MIIEPYGSRAVNYEIFYFKIIIETDDQPKVIFLKVNHYIDNRR
jgi:hypothetical protein